MLGAKEETEKAKKDKRKKSVLLQFCKELGEIRWPRRNYLFSSVDLQGHMPFTV
jgi:hypothetical protein